MSQNKTYVSTQADVGEHGLKKHKIGVMTVVFMIFCLVAAGCYGIEEMIPQCGPGLTVTILIALPIFWAMPFAMVAAELGSVRPQEGGYYKWIQEALGEFWGFQAGWWRTIGIYIDNALYVILAGGYCASQWDIGFYGEFGIKLLMILIFTYINIRGVKDIGFVSNILAIIVMVAFGLVAVCGFMNWGGNAETAETITWQFTSAPAEGLNDWFFYIAGGISVGLWMFSGYESMSTIAGEVEDPQVIPKGTVITVPLIALTYILPTVGGLGSLGQFTEWGTESNQIGYADVVETFWGPTWGMLFVIVAIVAQCSIFNTYIASASRGFFSMADDNLAPPFMVKCDKKHGVPYRAVLSVAIACVILSIFPYGLVVILDVHLIIASYILIFISAIVLRKRLPIEEYKYKIPGGVGVLTCMCILPITIALFALLINGSDFYIAGMTAMATGPFFYTLWRRKYGGLTKKDPVRFPVNPKTGLQKGDTRKMTGLFFGLTVFNVVMEFFAPWYEKWGTPDAWAQTDYLDGWLEGTAITNVQIQHFIQIYLHVFTAVCAIAMVVCFIMAKKVEEPKESK